MTPEQDAEAFELVRVQGVSYRDAAKRMGETLQRVRSAVTREAVRRGKPSFAERVADAEAVLLGDAGLLAALGVTPPAVGSWLQDAASKVNPPDHEDDGDEPEDDGDNELPIDADVETIIRYQIRRVTRSIKSLNARGADAEAQRYTRVLSTLAHELRQHDKAKRDADGVMTYTLDDVTKAEAELDKMALDVAHRPFVCAECGRVMRRAEAESK